MAIKHCILLCIVLTSSLFLTSDALPANLMPFHRLQKRSGGLRLCGRMLVEALATICQSEYYAPSHIKRNYAYQADFDSDYPEGIMKPQSPLDFFSMNQLSRRGIADECCVKSCSIGQLASYCGPTPGK